MTNDHLSALELRLSHERVYLRNAKTEHERELRRIWIAQLEREILSEHKFCETRAIDPEMSDAELLAALDAP